MLENPMVSQFEAEELSIPKCEAMIQELEKTLALLENASEKVPAETELEKISFVIGDAMKITERAISWYENQKDYLETRQAARRVKTLLLCR